MYCVVGIRRVDYTSKKTGNRVLGVNLYCNYEDDHTEGFACDSIFFSDDRLQKLGWTPQVSDMFWPVYNKYGRIEDVKLDE